MSLNTLSDLALIERIQTGNTAAFRILYYRHADMVFGLVSRLLGKRRSEAEDVTQEVFIQVHRSVGHYAGASSFTTWIHRVTVNVCFSHLRRACPHTNSLDEKERLLAVSDAREAHIDARRKVRRLYEMLEEQPIKNRVVFTLYEFQGLTLAEIAEIMEISIHTAASRLRRSRETLMKNLSDSRSATGGR